MLTNQKNKKQWLLFKAEKTVRNSNETDVTNEGINGNIGNFYVAEKEKEDNLEKPETEHETFNFYSERGDYYI